MTTRTDGRHVDVGGTPMEVVRKNIKHLHIGVYPPDGQVRVSAPLRLDDDAVRTAVVSRLGWIRRKQAEFRRQDRQSPREFVTGESHYFEGRRYRLDVRESAGPPLIRLINNTTLALQVRPGSDRRFREAVLHGWYRSQLRACLPALFAKWEARIGVRAAEVRIKKMKTRWGTCNTTARRIWLNLELAKKPAICLECVVVHELVHLVERGHGPRFQKLMDSHMPQWRLHKDTLNQAPLGHDDWRC